VIVEEVSGLENPILSNAYGSGTCQKPWVLDDVLGKGDEGSFGIYRLARPLKDENDAN
jgi:hypothetical protein